VFEPLLTEHGEVVFIQFDLKSNATSVQQIQQLNTRDPKHAGRFSGGDPTLRKQPQGRLFFDGLHQFSLRVFG
jgi:hypothetical protein